MAITSPIVGMHFRPPAKQIVEVLPVGTPLILQLDPTNPYSQPGGPGTGKAIKVLLDLSEVDEDFWQELEDTLSGTGTDREELEMQSPLHIAFVAEKKFEEAQAAIWNIVNAGSYSATFSRDMAGKPIAEVEPAG